MADASFIRSTTRQILLALQAEIVLRTEMDPTRVIISVAEIDSVPHFGAAQDVVIAPEAEDRQGGDLAGRVDERRTRNVRIVARTRLSLDVPGQDAQRLTYESLGHYALEDKIHDAVRCFMALDDDSNVLCAPARTLSWTKPRHDPTDPSWVSSGLVIELEYSHDLDQSRQ